MVDTWATVGSCAQIGKNVHLSGGVGIGGVLEPLQANPTIIEDNCFIGARSEVVEGVDRRGRLGHFDGRRTSARAPRSTTAPPARCIYGRIPAGSVVVSGNLPSRGRQIPACTARSSSSGWTPEPAPKTTHQRTAARLNPPHASRREHHVQRSRAGTMERILRLMGGKRRFGCVPLGPRPGADEDQRLVHAHQQTRYCHPTQPRDLLAEVLPPGPAGAVGPARRAQHWSSGGRCRACFV